MGRLKIVSHLQWIFKNLVNKPWKLIPVGDKGLGGTDGGFFQVLGLVLGGMTDEGGWGRSLINSSPPNDLGVEHITGS